LIYPVAQIERPAYHRQKGDEEQEHDPRRNLTCACLWLQSI
jgi:hypothetical protein